MSTCSTLVGDKNTTIARLRKLLFGAKTEKTAAVIGDTKDSQLPPTQDAAAPAGDVSSRQRGSQRRGSGEDNAAASRRPRPQRGRRLHGRREDRGASRVASAGRSLPEVRRGHGLRDEPARGAGAAGGPGAVGAMVYYLQKLRCNLCGVVFTAEPPEGVGGEKYDATVGSMIALLKYGSGMPFNRAEKLQGNLGIPLPASTQWDIVEAQAERAEPVFEELVRQAAQGDVVYNDDTTVKILELMGERARQAALADEASRGGFGEEVRRRSGQACSPRASSRPEKGSKIALFLSGRQHAGENLKDVLVRRAAELPPPIQMCDALSRNLPGELKTIVANCLAHGRRQFVDVADRFPEECRHVLESLAVIYHNDALARERNLSPRAATALPPGRERPDDGGTPRLACTAVRRAAGGAQLGAGRGDFVPAEALGEADALPARARGAVGQQHLRAGVEKGHPASAELLVLQDLPRCPCGGRLHEPDPHLRTLRGQSLRLPHRTGSSRGSRRPRIPRTGCPGIIGRHSTTPLRRLPPADSPLFPCSRPPRGQRFCTLAGRTR